MPSVRNQRTPDCSTTVNHPWLQASCSEKSRDGPKSSVVLTDCDTYSVQHFRLSRSGTEAESIRQRDTDRIS
jgi:hypothetical protein